LDREEKKEDRGGRSLPCTTGSIATAIVLFASPAFFGLSLGEKKKKKRGRVKKKEKREGRTVKTPSV